jgi:hypothetical protein
MPSYFVFLVITSSVIPSFVVFLFFYLIIVFIFLDFFAVFLPLRPCLSIFFILPVYLSPIFLPLMMLWKAQESVYIPSNW